LLANFTGFLIPRILTHCGLLQLVISIPHELLRCPMNDMSKGKQCLLRFLTVAAVTVAGSKRQTWPSF
jgi:hypothetical protein